MSAVFTPTRLRISVDRYQKMVAMGVLTKHDRVELIEGEILEMAPIGVAHAEVTDRLTRVLVMATGDGAIVRVGGPVDLGGYSEPQPDVLVLKNPGPEGYRRAHPKAVDVLLLIEVSDSSLGFDRGAKRDLYARYAIPEYWVVDVGGQRVITYLEPVAGSYQRTVEFRAGDTVCPRAIPDACIAVAGLLA
jgi:Uma2 family endonuclease